MARGLCGADVKLDTRRRTHGLVDGVKRWRVEHAVCAGHYGIVPCAIQLVGKWDDGRRCNVRGQQQRVVGRWFDDSVGQRPSAATRQGSARRISPACRSSGRISLRGQPTLLRRRLRLPPESRFAWSTQAIPATLHGDVGKSTGQQPHAGVGPGHSPSHGFTSSRRSRQRFRTSRMASTCRGT